MSDRRAWLDERCLNCWAAPGSRCRADRYSSQKRPSPAQRLHIARGWRERDCPMCKALSREPCHTPSGREATQPHAARLRAGRRELATRQAAWEELERRGATVAEVPFTGVAGEGGSVGAIVLGRVDGAELECWVGRDELAYALEAPLGSLGTFAGHPKVVAAVTWTTADRRVVIRPAWARALRRARMSGSGGVLPPRRVCCRFARGPPSDRVPE